MAAFRAALDALARAMRNPGIRRLELAWLAGIAADSALLVVLLVVAYGRDGVLAAGLLGAFRMVPAMLAGAGTGAALRRWSGPRILVAAAALRVVGAIGASIAIAAQAPTGALFIVAAIAGAGGGVVRPIQATLMPALARTPEELVASNVAWGTVEGVGALLGPAVAAALIYVGLPAGVALAAAVGFAATGLAIVGLRFENAADANAVRTGSGRALLDGLRAIARKPVLRWATSNVFGQTLTRGLLNTFVVVTAVELVGLGEPGVGTLTAAMGVGGLVGGIFAMSIVRPDNLIRADAVAVAFWGLPITLVGLVPDPTVAIASMGVIGVANAAFDVAILTIFQRGSGNEERGAVFSVFEAVAGLGVVCGSLLAPVLLAAFGSRGGLAVGGAVLPILAVITYARIGRVAEISAVDERLVTLLRRVPAFAALPLTAVERLARAAVDVRFAPGEVLMRQGEPGDRFLVIETGQVEVSVDGLAVDRLGQGDGLGEIALLRQAPRTATAIALSEVRCWSIGAIDFCTAASGPTAAGLLEQLARRHLERAGSVA